MDGDSDPFGGHQILEFYCDRDSVSILRCMKILDLHGEPSLFDLNLSMNGCGVNSPNQGVAFLTRLTSNREYKG